MTARSSPGSRARVLMNANGDSPAARISLRAPVITMVLAATVIPVELRPLGRAALSFDIRAADVVALVSDVVVNLAGYVPVGIVLAGLGQWRAVLVATSMATFAESAQFVMMHRDPSAIDLASDVIGATLGAVASTRWRIPSTDLRFTRWSAPIAATLAVLLVLGVWATSGYAPNARGAASPGTLEAHWKLDESRGLVAFDSSGHGLDGKFSREPKRVVGVIGGAVTLDDQERPLSDSEVAAEWQRAGGLLYRRNGGARPGISGTYLARLETARHDPTLSMLEKVAKAVRVKVVPSVP